MEVFAVAFCHPVAPVKEHTPRRIRNRLGEVSVLNHVAWLEFLSNNRVKLPMVKKFVGSFCDKIKTLAGNNICLFCQCVLRLIPSFAAVLLARQITMKFHKFAFGLSVKARVGYLFPIRSRQKIVCANVHTTGGFWNTFQRVRHFANDKAIPPACRLFQRDLFRVSDKWTVLADFHFTEFRHFQHVMPFTCFTDRILTDTLTTLEFVLTQRPRQRANRTPELRIAFFFDPSLQRR